VNQDLGIFVSIDGGADQLAAWKESGGSAGTFSPNAAFVQTVYPLTTGHSYRVKLKWRTNVPTVGAIRAGAGLGPFSPTSLTAQVVTSGIIAAQVNKQYGLSGSDGTTWQALDASHLVLNLPVPAVDTTVVLSANADLWTQNAGINQDLGIFVTGGAYGGQLVAWKESGGSAGTFSPNAAFVQILIPVKAGVRYTITLEWKTNIASGGTIRVGAGLPGAFSPTSLTAEMPPPS